MNALQFKTVIDAPRQKVWDTLWNDATYREWTTVFTEGSRVITPGEETVTNWEKGGKVWFVDGNNHGMEALIADNQPNQFMSFQHLGELKDGQLVPEHTYGENYENYTLNEADGKTELVVDLNMGEAPESFTDYFNKTFPPALEKVKEIAERH